MGRTLLASTLLAARFVSSAAGATWYVNGSVSEPGDGHSWETAFNKIQEGIDKAGAGDTVMVAEGIYVENIQFKGRNVILRSTNPLDPDVVAETVIDGGKEGSVVVFDGREDETCVLDGFTIQNGLAFSGGGIRGEGTYATIQNNAVLNNSAVWGGGVFACDGLVRVNRVIDNSATKGGGIVGCGGVVENNIVRGNSAEEGGGGLRSCAGTIQNNFIFNNFGNVGGGLAYCHGAIRSNLIAGNSAEGDGAALYDCDGANVNNTISGNWTLSSGALAQCQGVIQGCILWGNTAAGGSQVYRSSVPSYSCIQGWTPPGRGEGNIALNPRFADPDGPDDDPATFEDNDYRLSVDSPCIDAGLNQEWMWEAVDLDGNPRIHPRAGSWRVDMGAYEFVLATGSFSYVIRASGGKVRLIWTSRPGESYRVWSCRDLVTDPWVEEVTVSSHGPSASWTDPEVGQVRKFYRIGIE